MSDALKRHFDILKMLSKDRALKTIDVHQKLEALGHSISKRTVERDLQCLSLTYPIVTDEKDNALWWRYAQGVAINLFPGLSEAEAVSFIMLKQLAEQLLPESLAQDLEPYFQEAKRTLSSGIAKSAIRSWPDKIRTVPANQPLMKPHVPYEVQKEVHAALLRDHQLRVHYQAQGKSEPKEYVINLLGLVEHGAAQYLVANFEGHDSARILALHRIHSAQMHPTKTQKLRDFDLDAYIASGAFGFSGDAPEIQVVLRFYNGAGFHLKETPLSKDQSIRDLDMQTLEVTTMVRDNRRFRWWLLGFGADVEVLSPDRFRREVAEQLAFAMSHYDK
ncbi:WYL domain-containing protein [Undibacterium sp. LX40W]|uniref:WYL domain-containing protein n=1 Tax=Undibacterium nitidum TaxID=2762298 RepID=A0A923KPA3_9BURK|nr:MULTISPECIES: WYL domain-containing protein [Undibacterium]MBC3881568.1 WYL domain-containing protein [Undibacterium nitidum]MBC3891650.1 WYL domain-containing protein [Undibacterium sp. LX40W]